MNVSEKFTPKAQEALGLAFEHAKKLNRNVISTEFILLGLIEQRTGMASKLLRSNGANLANAVTEVIKMVGEGTDFYYSASLSLDSESTFNDDARKVVEYANDYSTKLHQEKIDTQHLLLGLIKLEESNAAWVLLQRLGVDPKKLRGQIFDLIGSALLETHASTGYSPNPGKTATPVLNGLTIDLTEQAKNGKLDPVIGREEETKQVIDILGARTKNCPALIGWPGVGKTAILRALAQLIVKGEVPDDLLNVRLLVLDQGACVANTQNRGMFEEKITNMLNEIRNVGNVILVIDEMHMMMSLGSAEGSVTLANLLKQPLSNNELRCIGATTIDDFRKRVEPDAAFKRRFKEVMVDPPSPAQTLEILRGMQPTFEKHANVTVEPAAMEAAVKLSERFMPDEYQPDKSLGLIDNACSAVNRRSSTLTPEEVSVKERLQKVQKQRRQAALDYDPDAVAKWRVHEDALTQKLSELQEARKLAVPPVVTVADIEAQVAKATDIPVERLREDEKQRLLRMPEELHKRIIGQNEAVQKLCDVIQVAFAGLRNPKKPIGSFIFAGPTGVGKTELCKALEEFLFSKGATKKDVDKAIEGMLRIDMSEYDQSHSGAKFVGAIPGYVGYQEGGQLTEPVKRKPYRVVLFDEIEKAHPNVFNYLLQVLDEGHLTDSKGHTVSFKNTVIVMTTNVGAQHITDPKALLEVKVGFAGADQQQIDPQSEEGRARRHKKITGLVEGEMKKAFPPEFLNRVGATIIFEQQSKEECAQISVLKLKTVASWMLDEKGIELSESDISDAAKELIVEEGFNPLYGARPLDRAIERLVQVPLAKEILAGKFNAQDKISVDRDGDKLVFAKKDA